MTLKKRSRKFQNATKIYPNKLSYLINLNNLNERKADFEKKKRIIQDYFHNKIFIF